MFRVLASLLGTVFFTWILISTWGEAGGYTILIILGIVLFAMALIESIKNWLE